MSGDDDRAAGRWRVNWRTPLALAATVVVLAALVVATPLASTVRANAATVGTVAAVYLLLLTTSGFVVRGALAFAAAEVSDEQADTGRAVGKVENVLVLTLVLANAYTALGLVFTAKSIVRWQDMNSGDTTYYLTGSITNFTYSLGFGVAMQSLVALPAL